MTDTDITWMQAGARASIVAFLTAEAAKFDGGADFAVADGGRDTLTAFHLRSKADLLRELAARIARGDDVSAIVAPA